MRTTWTVACWMLLAALAPAAAVARSSELDAWRARLLRAGESIKAGEGAAAERVSRQVLTEMIERIADGEAENEWLSLAMEHLALAKAVQRDEEGAVYWWWSAQALWPGIARLDLTEFGDAAQTLARAGAPDVATVIAADAPQPADGPPVIADEHPLAAAPADAAQGAPTEPKSLATPAPPPAPTTTRAHRVTKDMTPPRLKKRVEPAYPRAKLETESAGSQVVLQTIVDETGRVTRPSVVQAGTSSAYLASTLLAASQWEYEPATQGGIPVPVYLMLRLKFTRAGR